MGIQHAGLGYDITGPEDAPVLVLGSSLGTTRSMWDAMTPTLARRFRVVRYDHLGHGESEVPDGPYTVDRLADELAALLSELGIERAHHGGVSLGGMVALRFAAGHPERVDRLAIVCSSAHLPPRENWIQRAAAVRAGGVESVADSVVGRWFTDGAPAETVANTRSMLAGIPDEGYAACCDAIRDMDLRPVLGGISAPTVAVAGADDQATPVEHAKVIADGIRAGGGSAGVQVVADAAHLAAVERPDAIAQIMLDHLE